MKNQELWRPSKYVLVGQKLSASRSIKDLNIASRLTAQSVAYHYDAALHKYCSGDVLDLGCGKAPLYILYRTRSKSITCVDWGSSPHDISHADMLCDLNNPIPLPDASFDTIILSDVLEHIYHPKELLAEIRRMLRPDGRLIMNVPFLYWLHEQPYDYYRYTRFALEKMASDSDLDIIELKEIGGAPEVFTDFIAKLSSNIKVIGGSVAKSVQWCCLSFVKTNLGRKVSATTSARFPLGYFLIASPNVKA